MTLASIRDNFAFLDDWEDRYRYVIELGRALPELPDELRNDDNKVRGCASQVWLATKVNGSGSGTGSSPTLNFSGDSDALIVRGLIAILFAVYDGKSADEIAALNAEQIFSDLGLQDHLTPQRSNGLASMVARIRHDARQAASAGS